MEILEAVQIRPDATAGPDILSTGNGLGVINIGDVRGINI